MKRYIFTILLLLVFGLVPYAEAADFYVSTPDEFQNALTEAQSNGEDDTIYVAPGTYNITETLTYTTADGDGKLTIRAQDPNNKPILDGGGNVQIMNIQNDGDYDDQGDIGADITIDGLVFKNGKNGVYIDAGEANITVSNSTFSGNSADYGGGAYVESSSGSVTVSNSTFSENSAAVYGGGAYVESSSGSVTVSNSTFSGNSAAVYGGGAYVESSSGSVTVSNSTFSGNSAEYYGGGAYVWSSSGSVTVSNSTFSGNSAADCGGGAYVWSSSGSVTVSNSTFSGNSAGGGGGALVSSYSGSVTVSNSTFSENSAVYGGGAYVGSNSGVILTNNSFYKDTANYGGGIYFDGAVYLRLDDDNGNTATGNIYNNILWQNSASSGGGDIYVNTDGSNNVNIYYNDLTCNDFSGSSTCLYLTSTENYTHAGNISADPLFIDPENGNFHLQANSPCIDAGDNEAPELPETDFEGDPRIINDVVDIGADEYNNSNNQSPEITSFSAEPTSGQAPLDVTFTCSASDPDGHIPQYKWDFDGDGSVDQTTTDNTITHTYNNAGTYNATVTVVDDEGASTSRAITITITSSESGGSGETTSSESSGGGGCTMNPNAGFSLDFLLWVGLPYVIFIIRKRKVN